MHAITEKHIGAQTSAGSVRSTKSKYRPEIDGLRAFAVISVIINHFNKELLPSGYLGNLWATWVLASAEISSAVSALIYLR